MVRSGTEKKSGEIIPEWLHITTIKGEKDQNLHYVAIARDLSKIKERENRIAQLAYYDCLTGLANRHLLLDRLNMAIAHAVRYGSLIAVIFVDLNKFKPINDQYGHKAGDRVLEVVAKRLQHNVRSGDTCSRIGGDEFVIVISTLQHHDELDSLLSRIKQEIELPIPFEGREHEITASLGTAFYPDDGKTAEQLIDVADQAMYQHKHS